MDGYLHDPDEENKKHFNLRSFAQDPLQEHPMPGFGPSGPYQPDQNHHTRMMNPDHFRITDEEDDGEEEVEGLVPTKEEMQGKRRRRATRLSTLMNSKLFRGICRGMVFLGASFVFCVVIVSIVRGKKSRNSTRGSSPANQQSHNYKCGDNSILPYQQYIDDMRLGGKLCADNIPINICKCLNPLYPHADNTPSRSRYWVHGFDRNKELAQSTKDTWDVVFFGDAAVEHFLGTTFGVARPQHNDTAEVFNQLFRSKESKYKGLPLGLNQDRCSEVLYRMQNGELPESLNAKVFWLVLGTNDLEDNCAVETMVTCQLQVAEYIRAQKPNAIIVFNSILPHVTFKNKSLLLNPIWHRTRRTNDKLECYADQFSNVEFFNATSIFLDESGEQVSPEAMVSFYIPTAEGSRLWGVEIVKKLTEIIG